MTGDQAVDTREEAYPKRTPLSEVPAASLGDVLGLLAHDLRNPLAALSSNVGFLTMLGEEMSDDAREAVDDLQLSIEAMGRIIDSLELVCNELRGASVAGASKPSVGGLIDSVALQAERAAQSHGVSLKVSDGGLREKKVLVSEQVFQRALAALLHNAIATAPARSEVHLGVFSDQGRIFFEVRDLGSPIATELVSQALSAEGQSQIKTAPGGRYSRGLGLYVASRCAELAGGTFSINRNADSSALSVSATEA